MAVQLPAPQIPMRKGRFIRHHPIISRLSSAAPHYICMSPPEAIRAWPLHPPFPVQTVQWTAQPFSFPYCTSYAQSAPCRPHGRCRSQKMKYRLRGWARYSFPETPDAVSPQIRSEPNPHSKYKDHPVHLYIVRYKLNAIYRYFLGFGTVLDLTGH